MKFDAPYNPKIEEFKDFKDSLFKNAYETACRSVRDIMNNQKKDTTDGMLYNLVPFIGDRGSGKTSAMLSFRKYLDSYPSKYIAEEKSDDSCWIFELDKYKLENSKFIALETIDAGHFEKHEDLFGVVLARMLAYYNSHINDEKNKDELYHRSAVYNKFSTIYKNFVNTNVIERDFDLSGMSALKVLEELDTSQNLKSSFIDLVKEFVAAMREIDSRYDSNDTYVVISIDDLDMNLDNAHKMMEQIQSYMMIPKVIVLITASYDNLMCICLNYYSSFFKEVIHAASSAKIELDKRFLDSCEELAHEYLNKFLPVGKMIHLRHQYSTKLYIIPKDLNLDYLFTDVEKHYTYTLVVASIILRGTGIYLYANDSKRCFIEPESIRAKGQYIHKIKHIRPVFEIGCVNDFLTDKTTFADLQEDNEQIIKNLNVLSEDISVRHIGTFPETQRRRLKSISLSNLRDISRNIYFSAINVHETHETDNLMPWSHDNIHRNPYSLSHVIDILDSLERINDVNSYKPFVNTVLGMVTTRLMLEKFNYLEAWLEQRKNDYNADSYKEYATKLEYDIVKKYIGFSLFGWFDNQLVRPMPEDFTDSVFITDEIEGDTVNIGFSLDININSWFRTPGNGFMSKNRTINIKRIHAFAVLLMFLSNQSYKISDDYTTNHRISNMGENWTNAQILKDNFRFGFIDNVDFAVSAFFVNICKPNIIIDFYCALLTGAIKSEYPESELMKLYDELVRVAKTLNVNVKGLTYKKFIRSANGNDSEWYKKYTECLNESVVPVLNIGLMYNIAREVRKDIQGVVHFGSPWELYCEYFKKIGNELNSIDEYYSDVDIKGLYSRYHSMVPTERDKNSFFYLDKSEIRYFNNIIESLSWQDSDL